MFLQTTNIKYNNKTYKNYKMAVFYRQIKYTYYRQIYKNNKKCML